MPSRPAACVAAAAALAAIALAPAAALGQPAAPASPAPAASPAAAPSGPGAMAAINPADPWPGMKRLLVIADVQTGFHHDSINHAIGVIEQLGREHHEWATVIRTDSQLLTKAPIVGQGTRYAGRPVNARNLTQFDAVFFLGSGTSTLTEQQKADLLSFVREDGKGFVAGHAASVAYYDWPAYLDMIGGFMDYEYRPAPMALLTEDPAFPGARAFPRRFVFNDQFPVMRAPFSSKDVHVILRLDADALTPEQRSHRPDGDIPVVWAKTYGKGRVYNLTIGHREEVWDDAAFRELARQGIRWALGLVKADARSPAERDAEPAR
ncbi:ThuA domain-containing protein [Novosphingobium piscinae]|uniref:ThuA domain-containing protein n=1 Tax=Novosphingobium piscinae TaxID=1507448 RepID=A0A7X1KNN3_9SPHN|nr:ThuA domain-containing protein [Novosphingobium piscinae]MBC2667618.1 ThuA domain-containing protein [Novosphingobium piscinae]